MVARAEPVLLHTYILAFLRPTVHTWTDAYISGEMSIAFSFRFARSLALPG